MEKVKKILINILFGISIIIFLIAVYFTISGKVLNKESYLFGYKPYVIISESMSPTIKKYGIIVVKKVKYESIKEKDIINFKIKNDTNVCHRVMEITENGFVTKGDNSKIQDNNYVTKENFVGKIILKSNILANYLEFYNKVGIFIALIAPITAILLIVVAIKLLKRKRKI